MDARRQELIDELNRRQELRNELNRRASGRQTVINEALPKSQPIDKVRDLLYGAVTGLGKGGQAIASALTGGYAPTVDIEQEFSPIASSNKSVGGEIAKGIGEYLPYALAGGSTLLPELGIEATSKASIPYLTSIGQLGAGVASGAALSDPNQTNAMGWLPSGRTGGAIENAIINALTHGAGKGLEALRPSKMFRGNLSPEELQKNLDTTQGTNTNVGEVVQSPYLKRLYENILPYIPMSGAGQRMLDTAKQIKDIGKNIFSDIGVDTNLSGQDLQDALKSASKQARIDKELNYQKLNQMADKAGVNVGRENFAKKAQEAIDEINLSPELKREFPSDFLADLQEYAKGGEGNNLKRTNIFRGKLGDKASDFYTNGNNYEYGIVKNLQDALDADINSAIDSSGNPDLKEQYIKSQKEYREKYAPFEDPEIVKYTRRGGDTDLLLSSFLKTGQNDRSVMLKKLIEKLPEEATHLPLQLYLSKAIEDGEINPLKLRTLYNKLGENQKNVLIKNKDFKNQLDRYVDLVDKNVEPLTVMANPKTGQRALDPLTLSMLGLLGKGVAGNWGAFGLGVATPIAARTATKYMTSPAVRESLVENMIKNQPRFASPKSLIGSSTFIQGLKNALSNNTIKDQGVS